MYTSLDQDVNTEMTPVADGTVRPSTPYGLTAYRSELQLVQVSKLTLNSYRPTAVRTEVARFTSPAPLVVVSVKLVFRVSDSSGPLRLGVLRGVTSLVHGFVKVGFSTILYIWLIVSASGEFFSSLGIIPNVEVLLSYYPLETHRRTPINTMSSSGHDAFSDIKDACECSQPPGVVSDSVPSESQTPESSSWRFTNDVELD